MTSLPERTSNETTVPSIVALLSNGCKQAFPLLTVDLQRARHNNLKQCGSRNTTRSKHTRDCRIWGPHSGGYESYYLLGYNAVSSVESKPKFRRNISPPPSGSTLLATCFQAGFLLGLFFDPEDGDDMFLRNVSWPSTDYTALYPRR
jgi:hypothetical protein